jgi:pilus assembly protein CpaC
MSPLIKFLKRIALPLITVETIMLYSTLCFASPMAMLEKRQPMRLDLVIGKSILVKTSKPAKRVSIAEPKIADFIPVSPSEIFITGKSAGVTSLTLWERENVSTVYDVVVTYDIARLKQSLHDILPQEMELRVFAIYDTITLSGRVSSSVKLSEALAIAQAYAPEGKIRNLVEVGGVHQVMLVVRVAEIQRGMARRMGVNFNYLSSSGNFGITKLGGLTELVNSSASNLSSGPLAPFSLFVSPAVNALFRFSSGNTDWTGFIDALKQDGLIKILAEPTLIALSGKEASFLAGGEFPVPVPQGLGSVAIEYKTFGVGIKFKPIVLSNKKINITVAPEVSELDFSTSVKLQGFTVPGLTTRKVETVVELADGQSFAIAGLLRETVRDVVEKYPILGDIPILGTLFRSRSFQKGETELIIIATPHLVKPLDVSKQPLPTDYYKEPSLVDIYLRGNLEGAENQDPGAKEGRLEGEFGHETPKVQHSKTK